VKKLLKPWNTARTVRFVAGLGIGIFAVLNGEYFLLLLAAWLLLQGILNISCCGTACSPQDMKPDRQELYKGEIKEYQP
jgi:uncharacterized membrane protein HdeD (DUF308 family)